MKSAPGCESSKVAWNGEGERSVKVAVQAVVAAFSVAQQQRRRLRLSRRMALGPVGSMVRRIARLPAEPGHGFVGDRREMPVKPLAQRPDRVRQRVGEIGVGAFPVSMPRHDDAPPEQFVPLPEGPQRGARLRGQHALRPRMALIQQGGPERRPVQPVDCIGHGPGPTAPTAARPPGFGPDFAGDLPGTILPVP